MHCILFKRFNEKETLQLSRNSKIFALKIDSQNHIKFEAKQRFSIAIDTRSKTYS